MVSKELWNRSIVLDSRSLRLRVLQYSHDHPLAGHFGQTKTLHQVRMHYYWPRLPVFVKDYWQIMYHFFLRQTVHHKPYGLLKHDPASLELHPPWIS